MRKHIICNHDENCFWFEYRTEGRAVINGQTEFKTVEEFEVCYHQHTGPLFKKSDFYKAMRLKEVNQRFRGPIALDKEVQEANRLNMELIAEHHHQYGPGMASLMGVPKEQAGFYNKKGRVIPDIEIGITKRGGWVPFLRIENQTFYIQYESSDKKEVEWMADNLRTAINKLL